jgi:hypothetical protein
MERTSVWLFLAFCWFALQASPATAQITAPQHRDLSCSTFPIDKSFGRRQLWDGYSASVEPTPTFKENSMADDACTGAIYDAHGIEVYSTTGPGVVLDRATGMDIDGDGAPDVVLLNGASGGSGGSWTVEVVSLKTKPHLLFKFEDVPAPPAGFGKDSRQRVVLWTGERISLDGYGFSNAQTPDVARLYHFENGKLREVTAEDCEEIEKSRFFPRLSASELEELKASKVDSEGFESLSVEDAASKALFPILQNIFCHRFDQALNLIDQSWPPTDRANLIQQLKQTLKDRDCPACSEGISSWH